MLSHPASGAFGQRSVPHGWRQKRVSTMCEGHLPLAKSVELLLPLALEAPAEFGHTYETAARVSLMGSSGTSAQRVIDFFLQAEVMNGLPGRSPPIFAELRLRRLDESPADSALVRRWSGRDRFMDAPQTIRWGRALRVPSFAAGTAGGRFARLGLACCARPSSQRLTSGGPEPCWRR